MSKTILSPNGESKVITVRRTESIDIPNIFKLIDYNTEKYFGKLNVFNFIEKAVFSICLVDEDDEIYGHATFFDFPNVDGVDPASWEDWLSTASESSYTPLNTLFIGLFASKQEYTRGCLREILHTLFIAVPDVHYCILILPESIPLDSAFVNIFRNLAQLQQTVGEKFFNVFVSERFMFEPILYIRNARVEDTDELTPLFDSLNNTLQAVYGDYYLAELIESQNDNMQCIVAEVNDYAVGLMSINSNVDVEFLNNSYDLEVFKNLEQTRTSLTPINQKIAFPNGSLVFQKSEEFTFIPVPNNSLASVNYCIDNPSFHTISAESSFVMLQPHRSRSVENVEVTFDAPNEQPAAAEMKPAQKANAFYIQLFAINEKYQTRAEDFLMKAFELFPRFDMCIISIPHLVPEFPLLRLFVRATPRKGCFPPQELYVFHKSGLVKDIKVRKACMSDFENIWFLTRNLRQQEKLLDDLRQFNDFRRDNNGTNIMAYVATVAEYLIGVAVIRDEEDIEYLRSHYNIEDYIYFNHHEQSEHAHLYHFVMNPAFKYLSKFFMREILRQSYKNCLYYPLFPLYASQDIIRSHSVITALSDMIPVRYRRQIIYPPKLGINAPSDQILKEIPAFALTHMNRKLALEPKMTINARIVVVGASTVGLSFLESLIFCPHLNFNNITLVSPQGMPAESEPDKCQNAMASNFSYSPDDLARASLRSWVSVVKSKMVKIVREKKHLITSNSHVIPYDHLFLCCGLQYTSVIWDVKNPFAKQDHSFFVINNLIDANEAINWIAQNVLNIQVLGNETESKACPLPGADKTGNIIIYGGTLDAYCFLQSILTLGLSGKAIHLMIPTTEEKSPELNEYVEEIIFNQLVDQNVQVHYSCDFTKWSSVDDSSNRYAYFHDERKSFKLEYVAFFCFHSKKIDYNAFKAINDACLIVDQKIVINNDFHTVDPNIWAAGTFTKYQRVLYSDNWVHAKFSSKEIGCTLASKILKIFDPAMSEEDEIKSLPENTELVTTYTEPRISSALLPGGLHYLNVSKPAVSVEFYKPNIETGYILKTGNPTDPCGYFEVYLNRYKEVETIICLRQEPYAASNFVELYGVHESILNNMLQRYEEGLIKDFFSFFMEPYCLPIYHDRFKDIRQEIRQVILDEKGFCNINAELRDLLQDTDGVEEMFPQNDIRNLIERYMKTNAPRRLVEHHVLAYLYHNYYHLPMFAKPGCI